MWQKLKTENLTIVNILEISKEAAKAGALECVDSMIAQAKKDFRVLPRETLKSLDLLNKCRVLILKNVNTQIVLDNLFLDLHYLNKKSSS